MEGVWGVDGSGGAEVGFVGAFWGMDVVGDRRDAGRSVI